MLVAIRERATGWLAWVIVSLITIPFALWGINSYFEGGSEIPAARVNGDEISVIAYQQDLDQRRRQLAEQFNSRISPELLDDLGIKQQVIDNLIDNRLLLEYTFENNFRFDDGHLKEVIQNYPSFQNEGQFDAELYQQVLRANRYTPQQFEQFQRTNSIVNQLIDGISQSSFYTESELNRILRLQGQTRSARYAIIETGQYIDQIKVSDDQITAYYDRNIERFRSEAEVKVDFIELSIELLSASMQPYEDEINALYEETKGRYTSPENRQASHILVSVDESSTTEEKQEKLARAIEILEQARLGVDFAELASEHSDDTGSAQNGGGLGTIARGQMVKPFEDAVFGMVVGEIAGPIETRFGYHIIRLDRLQESAQKPLADVRDEVEAEAREIQAEYLFGELAESFKNLVFENPDDIAVVAEELDLEIMSSDWFSADSGAGIASEAAVRRAAFSEDVLNEDLLSPAIEIGFDKLVAVHKTGYRPAALLPLETVKQEVIDAIRFEESREQVLTLGSDLLIRLESGGRNLEEWDQTVAAHNFDSWQLAEHRSDISDELRLLGDAVFSHSKPAIGSVNFGGVVLNNGDYALYVLEEVRQGNPEDADEALKAELQQRLLIRDGLGAFSTFQQSLRDSAEIEIFEDRL